MRTGLLLITLATWIILGHCANILVTGKVPSYLIPLQHLLELTK
jgi:hypothetical protein